MREKKPETRIAQKKNQRNSNEIHKFQIIDEIKIQGRQDLDKRNKEKLYKSGTSRSSKK